MSPEILCCRVYLCSSGYDALLRTMGPWVWTPLCPEICFFFLLSQNSLRWFIELKSYRQRPAASGKAQVKREIMSWWRHYWCYVINRQNMWRRYAVITSRYKITSSHDIVAWSKVDLSRMMCKTMHVRCRSFRRDQYDDGDEQDDGFRLRLVLRESTWDPMSFFFFFFSAFIHFSFLQHLARERMVVYTSLLGEFMLQTLPALNSLLRPVHIFSSFV